MDTFSLHRRAGMLLLLFTIFLLAIWPSAHAGLHASVSCSGNSAGQSVCRTHVSCGDGSEGVCTGCIGGANYCANKCLQGCLSKGGPTGGVIEQVPAPKDSPPLSLDGEAKPRAPSAPPPRPAPRPALAPTER